MMSKIIDSLKANYEYHEMITDANGTYYMVSIIAMLFGKYTVLLQPYNNKPGKIVLCETKATIESAYELFEKTKLSLTARK